MPRKKKEVSDVTEKTPEREISGSGVVGTQNEDRLKLYDSISDKVELARAEDFEEVKDEQTSPDATEDGAEREDPLEDDDESEETDEAKEQPRLITRKVNGKDVTLTEEQWLERASKVEAADQYLAEASRVYRQASEPPKKDAQENISEEDVALARAIQMGSEEEAVNAIRKLKSNPSIKPDDLTRIVDERLTFQDAANRFREKFPDIVSDQDLLDMVLLKDQKLIESGDRRGYWERYDEIGNDVRKKYGKSTFSEKQARKATVTPIRPAAVRAVDGADQEPDDSPSAVIASMAKARGQAA